MKQVLSANRVLLPMCLGLGAHFANAQIYLAGEIRSKVTRPVPEAIGKKFRDLVPDADSTSVEWLWHDDLYIVHYMQQYQFEQTKFKADGRLRDYSVVVKIDTLPIAVRRRIAKEMWKQEKQNPTAVVIVEAYYDCDDKQCTVLEWSALFFKSYEDVKQGIAASVFSRSISKNGRVIRRRKYPHFRV